MHTDQCKTHSDTLSYKHCKGVSAAVLQAETDVTLHVRQSLQMLLHPFS